MMRNLALGTLLATMPVAALAEPAPPASANRAAQVPAQLDEAQREGYRSVFAALREQRWQDAQIGLDTMKPGPLHAIARAELYTAKGSPRVELEPLVQLLNEAPELPQAEALRRLAGARGAKDLPLPPTMQRLIWQDGAPRRVRTKATASDLVATELMVKMQPLIKADDGPAAEALLAATPGLTPEAQTEWQARVAWMHFLRGDDTSARRLAGMAAEGTGDWAVQGRWMASLAAWRQHDCRAAEDGFEGVAARAGDVDLRAAGLYWAARADMACARPDRIQARLTSAAQFGESFYGQLARQALGLRDKALPAAGLGAKDWEALNKRPNIRIAAALMEVGEADLADDVIRQQAKIGNPAEFGGLVRLAETLNLAATTVWLAHNCPAGVTPAADARYPTPDWQPDSGWRVDKALVYAHTLEESRFRPKVTSPAGAYGLMQIMPAAATDFERERGMSIDKSALSKPSTNIDIGQRHLERLRDMGVTGGLLPKVIAAYNAGPKPVAEWNSIVHDGGDPLLYIESIPYWETRGYVTTVMRNYWMYEGTNGKAKSASRAALAQGMWPRFPGLPGAAAVRMAAPVAYAASTARVPAVPSVTAAAKPLVVQASAAAVPAPPPPAVTQVASAARKMPVTAAPIIVAKAQALAVTSPAPVQSTTATLGAMVKAIPGAVSSAASAVLDADLLRKAGAAMAMQPRAVLKAVAASVTAAAD